MLAVCTGEAADHAVASALDAGERRNGPADHSLPGLQASPQVCHPSTGMYPPSPRQVDTGTTLSQLVDTGTGARLLTTGTVDTGTTLSQLVGTGARPLTTSRYRYRPPLTNEVGLLSRLHTCVTIGGFVLMQ